MTVSSKPKPDNKPWTVVSTATGKPVSEKTYEAFGPANNEARRLNLDGEAWHVAART